jgi:hypothetical protein
MISLFIVVYFTPLVPISYDAHDLTPRLLFLVFLEHISHCIVLYFYFYLFYFSLREIGDLLPFLLYLSSGRHYDGM